MTILPKGSRWRRDFCGCFGGVRAAAEMVIEGDRGDGLGLRKELSST